MNKRVFLILMIVTTFFMLFVARRERAFILNGQTSLASQANVISVNLWRFNLDATSLQIDFLSKLNNYKTAKIVDYTNEPFCESSPAKLTGVSQHLYSMGIIRTATFSSDINYEGGKIGAITVEKYNLEIYNYLYLFSILSLFMVLVIVLDRLDHINSNLESIVRELTGDTQLDWRRDSCGG